MTTSETTAGLEGWEQTLVRLCVSVPSLTINLDSNIVAVSLPSIAHSLHADFSDIEWVISAYTLTFASLVFAGRDAGRPLRPRAHAARGFERLYGGIIRVRCGPNAMVLNAARALQGVGAALQLSAALSYAFRGPARARAFAFRGSVIGIAISLGPVVDGFITQ